MRWLTAGESHGRSLVAVLDGMPAGIALTSQDVEAALARRRGGAGRGARQSFEADRLTVIGGLWRGLTTGGPLAFEIANSEWPKWERTMSPDPAPVPDEARALPLTRPRPGHADLAGMIKYGQADARAILERSSARETAARVALGAAAAAYLEQAFGAHVVAHVVRIGRAALPADAPRPTPAQARDIDQSPVRCLDPATAEAMAQELARAKAAGDTLGGVVEVLAYGLPPGIGSHVEADRRLDAQLAAALMGVQAVKGVEIGAGFALAQLPGSEAHDEIFPGPAPAAPGHGTGSAAPSAAGVGHPGTGGRQPFRPRAYHRATNRAGGIEGGMSNGQSIVLRAAVKPIPTVPHPLATIDTATGAAARANHQRSDTSAVVPAAVVAEAVVALALARAAAEKFGGDTLQEVRCNIDGYLAQIPEHLR